MTTNELLIFGRQPSTYLSPPRPHPHSRRSLKPLWAIPALLALLFCTFSTWAQTNSNCCANCVAPYPLSYTNIVPSGTSFYANNLCQGTNNTLNDLLPNVPDGTSLFLWNTASGSFVSYQY